MQGIQLGFVIALETVKVGFVVFLDDLFDEQFLNLGGNGSIAFPYQHNEVLQEVGLLHVQLLTLDAEGIHGDRMLLGIADILATDILAQSLIRVTGIDHNDIGILLPKLAHHTVHMKGFAAARRAQAKEVTVVGEFLLAFLATDVDGDGYALAVGVIDLQWRLFALWELFLIHQATGGIAQGEEAVVVLVQGIAVAGEGADEQLQLVIGTLADLYADAPEGVLQMVGAFLQVGIGLDGNDEVEMAIDQLLVLSCDELFYLLDVLHSNLVAGIGQRGMTVLLLGQLAHLLLLAWQEDDLVEDYTLGSGDAVNNCHQVNRHGHVVDLDVGIRTDKSGQYDAIDIDKAIDLELSAAYTNLFLAHLEVVERDILVGIVLSQILVNEMLDLIGCEETGSDATVAELVLDLANLDDEVLPLLVVVAEQAALLVFLCDSDIGGAVGIFPAFEIAEIAL